MAIEYARTGASGTMVFIGALILGAHGAPGAQPSGFGSVGYERPPLFARHDDDEPETGGDEDWLQCDADYGSFGTIAEGAWSEEDRATEATLSSAAAIALQPDGLARLERFRELPDNWDGEGAARLNEQSVEALSYFFAESGLAPADLALFMSPSGLLLASWPMADGQLVELEFSPDRIGFFLPASGEEGEVLLRDGPAFVQQLMG